MVEKTIGKVVSGVDENRNLFITVNQTLASVGLDKLGKSGLANFITPATWFVDNKVNGSKPGLNDIGIWLTGIIVSGGAATITSLWKSKVDDHIAFKFKEAVKNEPIIQAQHMEPCYDTFYGPPQINAMKFASIGGTAWQHPNGLWICVKDKDGIPVFDYEPKVYKIMLRPKFPLVKAANGKYKYDTLRK
jgi:hypothetical protein